MTDDTRRRLLHLIEKWREEAAGYPVWSDERAHAAAVAVRLCADELEALLVGGSPPEAQEQEQQEQKLSRVDEGQSNGAHPPKLAPIKRYSKDIGVPYSSLRDAHHRGEFPVVKIGKSWYVDQTDMERWIEARKERS